MGQNMLVTIKDKISGNILFSCTIDQLDEAYHQAKHFEEMGLDIEIDSPSITETLASSLGKTGKELKDFRNSVNHELEDHDCLE
jgi:hypothetical protein